MRPYEHTASGPDAFAELEFVMNRKFNPTTTAPPGRYNHGMEVPAGSRLCFTAGQLGRSPDNSLPDDFTKQV